MTIIITGPFHSDDCICKIGSFNVLTVLKRLDSYPRVSVDRLVLSPICLYCWPVEDKVNTPC